MTRALRAALPALLLLPSLVAAAGTHVVDSRGNLLSVESITAVRESGSTASAIRVRTTTSDGRIAEEFLPDTLDDDADVAPVMLFDSDDGEPIILWSRYDGRRVTIAASRRSAGIWSTTMTLDTGGYGPIDFRADLDDRSDLQVTWKVEGSKERDELRHRTYDALTFAPDGSTVDPFSPDRRSRRIPRAGAPKHEDGTEDPGDVPSMSDIPGVRVPGEPKPAPISDFGVVAGCDGAVVYRVTGDHLGVATLSGGKWKRGEVNLGSEASRVSAASLAADIARRFCRP